MRGAVLLAIALTGCATPERAIRDRDTCDAAAAAPFLGRVADAAVLDELKRAAGVRTMRVTPPDTIVTTEYAFGRLSVDVDAARVIVRAACG